MKITISDNSADLSFKFNFEKYFLVPMDVVDNITEDNIRRNLHLRKFDCDAKLCYSQPEEISIKELHYNRECPGLYSFSQPTQIENLLISTQLLSSQSTSFNTVI